MKALNAALGFIPNNFDFYYMVNTGSVYAKIMVATDKSVFRSVDSNEFFNILSSMSGQNITVQDIDELKKDIFYQARALTERSDLTLPVLSTGVLKVGTVIKSKKRK